MTKLTCVLFGQFGDVFFVENVLLGGHPLSQQKHAQDGDYGEQEQSQTRFNYRHDGNKSQQTDTQRQGSGYMCTQRQTGCFKRLTASSWSGGGGIYSLDQSWAELVA